MKKLFKIIEKAIDGDLQGMTPYMVGELQFIYADLSQGIKSTTICEEVAKRAQACGLKVKARGIGWEISR